MKKFIKVTEVDSAVREAHDGEVSTSPLWINVDYIQAFDKETDVWGNPVTTLFMFVNSYEEERLIQETIDVIETPEEIMKLIQEAQ